MEREAAAIEAELHKLHRLELRAKRDETGRCSQVVPRVGVVSVWHVPRCLPERRGRVASCRVAPHRAVLSLQGRLLVC